MGLTVPAQCLAKDNVLLHGILEPMHKDQGSDQGLTQRWSRVSDAIWGTGKKNAVTYGLWITAKMLLLLLLCGTEYYARQVWEFWDLVSCNTVVFRVKGCYLLQCLLIRIVWPVVSISDRAGVQYLPGYGTWDHGWLLSQHGLKGFYRGIWRRKMVNC